MSKTMLMVAAVSSLCLVGCASHHEVAAASKTAASKPGSLAIGYDDRQIAKLHRGETTERQLLEWFGSPESRDLRPDARASLTWSFSRRTDGGLGHSGTLSVDLAPDGTVEAFSARGGPLELNRTVEFVQTSDADVRERMDQWRRESWAVLSISGPLRQPDGSIHRKAELARRDSEASSGFHYDDHQIASIRRNETTSAELVEWFGPAYCRNLRPDGRMQLAWNFGAGDASQLNVSLTTEGTVEAYSAHEGPR